MDNEANTPTLAARLEKATIPAALISEQGSRPSTEQVEHTSFDEAGDHLERYSLKYKDKTGKDEGIQVVVKRGYLMGGEPVMEEAFLNFDSGTGVDEVTPSNIEEPVELSGGVTEDDLPSILTSLAHLRIIGISRPNLVNLVQSAQEAYRKEESQRLINKFRR